MRARVPGFPDALDRAVLDAYGWADLQPKCEFILDYEDEEEDDDRKPKTKKKPWRHRWPGDLRDEILARLLALNAERASAEAVAGVASAAPSRGRRGPRKAASGSGRDLFGK